MLRQDFTRTVFHVQTAEQIRELEQLFSNNPNKNLSVMGAGFFAVDNLTDEQRQSVNFPHHVWTAKQIQADLDKLGLTDKQVDIPFSVEKKLPEPILEIHSDKEFVGKIPDRTELQVISVDRGWDRVLGWSAYEIPSHMCDHTWTVETESNFYTLSMFGVYAIASKKAIGIIQTT